MTNEIKITHSLRKRFVKDCSLPITVLQDPYFMHFVELYEDLFGSKTKYEGFTKLVERLGGEAEFFAESKKIIESAIVSIKETESYTGFCENKIVMIKKLNVPNINIYSSGNIGKKYLSIDMVKANYQSLSYYDKNNALDGSSMVIDVSGSYAEFIGQFTDEDYFIESKQIRQVIFGNLNPKRQQVVQRSIINCYSEVLSNCGFDVVCGSSDELLIDITNRPESDKDLIESIKTSKDHLLIKDVDFRYVIFNLNVVAEDRPFYIKEFPDKTFELKGVPSHYFAEVYRFVRAENLHPYDLITFYDGRLVKYIDSFLKVKEGKRQNK